MSQFLKGIDRNFEVKFRIGDFSVDIRRNWIREVTV